MKGSLFIANLDSPQFQAGTTEEVLGGSSLSYFVHPDQIPGRFVEFWGHYVGGSDATIRIRQSTTTPTNKAGPIILSVDVTANQGFFYGAVEYEIDEPCFLVVTGQLAVNVSANLPHMVIQISCEERPAPPAPPAGSVFSMYNNTDQVQFFLNAAEETILRTGFGPYFHALLDWDSFPGTLVKLHSSGLAGLGAPGTTRIRIDGEPTPDVPEAIVGNVELSFTDSVLYHAMETFVPKPTGRKMVTVSVEHPDGAMKTYTGPVLFLESNLPGVQGVLLHGPFLTTPAHNQISNWVVNFDHIQSANIKIAMSALTKTGLAASAASMHLRMGGALDNQASGTDLAAYSILSQVPLNQYMPSGTVVTIPNPGGSRLLKWVVTGDAATEAHYKSVLIYGV